MPKRQPIPVIKRSEVEAAWEWLQQLQDARTLVKKLEERYSSVERHLIEAIESGSGFESGARPVVVTTEQRRNVQWRYEFERRLGALAAKAVLDSTEPKIYKHLKFGP